MAKFVVGLMVGGLMEDPNIRIVGPYNFVEASNATEAAEKYDKFHKSDYFYSGVVGQLINDEWEVVSDYASKSQLLYAVDDAERNPNIN